MLKDLLRAFLKHGHKSRKKAIMNTLKQLSLSLKIKKKSKPPTLRLQRLWAPPADLLSPRSSENRLPSGRVHTSTPWPTWAGPLRQPHTFWNPAGNHRAGVPPLTPLVNGHGCLVLVMKKIVSTWTTPPCIHPWMSVLAWHPLVTSLSLWLRLPWWLSREAMFYDILNDLAAGAVGR